MNVETKSIDLQNHPNEFPPPEQAFEWPNQAVRDKNWLEAAQRWAVLREVYPEHAGTWFQGVNALIAAEKFDQAETLLNNACQRFPNHPNALLISAELAMAKMEWTTAEKYLSRCRKLHPGIFVSWIKSAACAEAMGNLEKSEEYNEIARNRFPDLPGPFYQHAEMAMRAEQWEQAFERWETLRELFPNESIAHVRAAEAAQKLSDQNQGQKYDLVHQYDAGIFNANSVKVIPAKRRVDQVDPIRLLELIWTMATMNLRAEVHRNYLSYIWWILEPILHMVVYYVAFGILLDRGGENFPVFLLAGLIPWMWFMKAVSNSSSSILIGHNLMTEVGLHPIVFPLVSLTQATIKQIPVFIILIGFLWFQGSGSWTFWWAIFPVILVQLLVTIVLSCAIAAIIPFARDLNYLVPTGLTLLLFLSGIFYDYRSIPIEFQNLFLMNPMAFLIKCYREIFIENAAPELLTLAWWGLGSVIACMFLLLVYRRLRHVYVRIVLE